MDYPKSDATVGLVGGKFTDGNPGAGVPASRDPSSWANLVTDELLSVLAAADIVPDEGVSTQLRDALFALGLQPATTAQKGVSEFADNVEAQALTAPGLAISPATLVAALQGANQVLDLAGYQKLPGGLIIQWGRGATTTASSTTAVGSNITFPVAFPVQVVAVVQTASINDANEDLFVYDQLRSLSNTGFRSVIKKGQTTGSVITYWIALGY